MSFKMAGRSLMALMVVCVLASMVQAEGGESRLGRTEVYAIGQMLGGDATTFPGGMPLEFESTGVYGIGLGYNISDKININGDMMFGQTDLVVGGTPIGTDLFMMDVNVDVNFMPGSFTPFVTGGVGFVQFTSDSVGAKETDFSYNVGVGARLDIGDNLLLKAMYRVTWTQMDFADDAFMLDGVSVSLGWIF